MRREFARCAGVASDKCHDQASGAPITGLQLLAWDLNPVLCASTSGSSQNLQVRTLHVVRKVVRLSRSP